MQTKGAKLESEQQFSAQLSDHKWEGNAEGCVVM
jgi:hypothetical protein